MEQAILKGEDLRKIEAIASHADWANEWILKYKLKEENIHEVVQKEIGNVFVEVLEDSGVFKRTEKGKEAFARFLKEIAY